jgi:hypothetical protein
MSRKPEDISADALPLPDPKLIPIEIHRKLFLDITDEIGRQLDARGVKDEDIERDFAAFKKRRRR